jgi:hypothetical protein
MPMWIQPAAETVLAVVTFLTLIVLCKYAWDTNRIARNSSIQVENSQRPFIALIMTEVHGQRFWKFKNQGCGPAVNIRYLHYLPDPKPPIMVWASPMAPGDEYSLPRENDPGMRKGGFRVEYDSLSGKRYRTTVEWAEGNIKTKLHIL